MYDLDLSTFLDKEGNIAIELEPDARELASFLSLVVNHTTKSMPSILTPTELKCFNKGCHGMVSTSFKPNKKEIRWYCPVCENEGEIGNWQGTKWDNQSRK
jgi:hypothetical protein